MMSFWRELLINGRAAAAELCKGSFWLEKRPPAQGTNPKGGGDGSQRNVRRLTLSLNLVLGRSSVAPGDRGKWDDQASGAEGVSCRTVHVSPVSAPTPHQGARIQLSVCHKLCYAIGGAPYQITGSALGFFLQIYLLDVAQLDPFCTSIILFMGRAWDAVTDPTIGFLVSRSRWTRIGRMMPWIVLSTPLAVLSYFLVWWVPPFEQGKVLWYLVFLCLFQTLQTCFHVPYSALTMFISSEQRERDSATAYRMTMEVLGTVVGTAIQGQIVGGANAFCKAQVVDEPGVFNASASPAGADANVSHACLDYTVGVKEGLRAALHLLTPSFLLLPPSQKQAYMVASGVTCAIYVLCAVVLLLGVREYGTCGGWGPETRPEMSRKADVEQCPMSPDCSPSPSAKPLSFYRGLKLLSATLSIPLWHRFLIRFGKKTAVYVGITWAVPFMVLIACVQSSLLVAYLCSVAAGASVAVAAGMGVSSGGGGTLAWQRRSLRPVSLLRRSMLPDVVDDFRVKNPELQGHEAIFYSSYVFFTKFASGVSLGVSTLSLSFSGYVTGSSVQPPLVDFTLRILVSPVPIVLIFVGLLIFRLNKQPDSETDSMETGTVV
ncbi:hypothetical protein Z043_125203 [Scleropages formosus]|uniref:Sodium-dependent lysophosphatidylcholine symporter 1-like n=1 Tax=Scleropages formosus TaxID=113540 RepID=A0A0N8JV44_SCLFO|nr:hypothetical protein Z043_125203 [Scleropages formosus]